MRYRRFAAVFAMIALVVGLCPAMAFATSGSFQAYGLAAQGDEQPEVEASDINDCEFRLVTKDDAGNDIYAAVDGNWALVFLKGTGVEFTPKVELYDGDELVDPGKYTVGYERTWWEDDDEKSELVDSIVIKEGGDQQCEFRVVVEAVDGGGYEGTYEGDTAEISAVNEYSLDTSYTDMYFDAFDGVVDDRINGMNPNYHVIPLGVAEDCLNSLKVRTGGDFSYEENTHNGNLLTPGTDYTVVYYKADPAGRTTDEWATTLDGVDGTPTAPGAYVMEVSGKGRYDGGSIVLLDIQANADDIEMAPIPDQAYTGKAIEPQLTVTCNGQALDPSTYQVSYANNTAEGEATVTVSGVNPILHWGFELTAEGPRATFTPDKNNTDRFFNCTKTASFNIVQPAPAKLKQPMKASVKAAKVKAKTLKKKAQTVTPITVKKAQGTVSYKVAKASAKAKKALKLNAKTGKITINKKTKKGTYTMKVKVTAAGNKKYKAGSQTVTVTVRVK